MLSGNGVFVRILGLLAGAILWCLPAGSLFASTYQQTATVSVVIEPVLSFALETDPTLQASPAADQIEMLVTVESNLGKPYQVTQQLVKAMPTVSGSAVQGLAVSVGSQPMTREPLVMISSDARGTAVMRRIPYQWSGHADPQAPAGAETVLMTITAQ